MAETTLESLVADLIKLEPHEIQSRLELSMRYCPNDFLLALSTLADSTEGDNFTSTIRLLYMVITGDLSDISLPTLNRIREPLLSCLKKGMAPSDDLETLAGIVTVVALQIYEAGGGDWTELVQYIVRTALGAQESAVAGTQAQESQHRVRGGGVQESAHRVRSGGGGVQESAHRVRSGGGGVQESALRILSCFPRPLFHQLRRLPLGKIRCEILQKLNSMDTELGKLLFASYALLLDASDSFEEEELNHFVSMGLISKLGVAENLMRFELLGRIVHRSKLFSESHLAYVFELVVDVVQPCDVAEGIKGQALTILEKLFALDIQTTKGALLKTNLETRRRFVTMLLQILEPCSLGALSKKMELGLRLLKRLLIVWEESIETIVASVNSCLKADNWEKRHAGMAAIVAISQVRQVTSINELCQDRILVALSILIKDSNQRVKMKAAQAICDFSHHCTPNKLSPFLNVIVTELLKQLKSWSPKVRAGAFAALNSLAICSKERFSICFEPAMDTLIGILEGTVFACERLVFSQCLFCISHIALAVGKERFRKHVGQVIGALRSLAACLIKTDHSIKVFVLKASLNFCRCLGNDFSVSESGVMPLLRELAHVPEVGASAHVKNQKALAIEVLAYCTSASREKQVISTGKVDDILHESEVAPKTKSISFDFVSYDVPPPIIQHHQPIVHILQDYHKTNDDKDGLEREHAEIDMFRDE